MAGNSRAKGLGPCSPARRTGVCCSAWGCTSWHSTSSAPPEARIPTCSCWSFRSSRPCLGRCSGTASSQTLPGPRAAVAAVVRAVGLGSPATSRSCLATAWSDRGLGKDMKLSRGGTDVISGNFLRVSRYQSGNSPVGPVLLELLWKLTGTFAQLCTGPRQVVHVRAAAGRTNAAMRAARASMRLILRPL